MLYNKFYTYWSAAPCAAVANVSESAQLYALVPAAEAVTAALDAVKTLDITEALAIRAADDTEEAVAPDPLPH